MKPRSEDSPTTEPNLALGGAFVLLLFNEENLALVRRSAPEAAWQPTAAGQIAAGGNTAELAQTALAGLNVGVGAAVPVARSGATVVFFALSEEPGSLAVFAGKEEFGWRSLEELNRLASDPGQLAADFAALLPLIHRESIRIPYLNYRENDYIFRFRTERQRNRSVYQLDGRAAGLYQSALCKAIKRLKRTKERSSASPAELNFGAVRYVLPSHFGFCLGVQNAIERAYESIAENPGRRVFMLSELIHNPFVNEDLLARGLNYLQTDKGRPLADPATGRLWWETLARGDVVIVPAFGATDEDKRRLIARGIALNRHDATCMLVEKVWKAARRYGQLGYTVVIHGKHEHEETKATFSNSAKFAPSLILRDGHEAGLLADIIREASP
jgi:4-hydroxy-3-methylbut-2-enyl diphosphate reductase